MTSIIQTTNSTSNQWIFPQPVDSAPRSIIQTIQAKTTILIIDQIHQHAFINLEKHYKAKQY